MRPPTNLPGQTIGYTFAWPQTRQPAYAARPSAAPILSADGLYQSGLTHAAMGNPGAAIAALRQAIGIRPALRAAWQSLAELLTRDGDRPGAKLARYAAASATEPSVAPPPQDWAAAERSWDARLRDVAKAEAVNLLRAHLATISPTDAVALHRLARLALQDRNREAAAPLLRRALDLAPDYVPACRDYAALLINRAQHIEALPYFERLLADDPDNAMCAALLATCLGSIGDFARAIDLYQNAGEAFETEPALLLVYAEALKHIGRRDDSVTIYRICLDTNPGQGLAWWGLANVKTEPFSPGDMQVMRAQLAGDGISARDRIHIHYALGRALEQARDHAASFAHYEAGAALKKEEINYDDTKMPAMTARMKSFFITDRFLAAAGDPDPAPIFILGLPRAGSTLIEQILASHSAVEGTVELPEISNIVGDIGRTSKGFIYPECLEDYEAADLAALGARYIERSRLYRKTDRPFFIDKMPANWAHIGMIHMILPNAIIIDARRDPMANCFAAYKQLFGHGVHYSYDFGDLARYYKAYLERMAHWDSVMPGRIHRVHYENMVNDTEAEIRALLTHCGLAFEPACLRFWESKRAVATPSAEQVRQPIFREGLDQWRRYEPWLDRLKSALA